MVKEYSHPDYILIGVTGVLLILGILILSSVSAPLSLERFGTTYYYLNHQLLFGLIPGIILAFLVFRIPLELLKKWVPIFLFVNLILLGMVFLPKIGAIFGGAARWISVGAFSFQPAEFLKLTFILYLASWLTTRTKLCSKFERKEEFSQTLIAFLIVIGLISLFLIFQPDISTLGVIVLVAAFLYFSAGTPLWHSILIILVGGGSLFALIKLAPYRLSRLLVFFKPEIDPMGIGYQIKQALIGVGSGGILGLGLGRISGQKFGFLPGSISDSIFVILAEETGFVGSLILILLFLIFLWRGFKIGKSSKDKFFQLAALGISSWITLQAFINIGSMIGILPLTGIPLPFISYGGSALIAELIGVGILLNISKNI
ncbi:MAG: FtsW/RodA/SpoVE family cell cycle protein [Patescibacteria group bacterium]|nr:FtsW/RodA/SpoVE family cell cycle protein [Patescibacteria group bacterium]